jgi:hypothetical protein
MTLPAKFGSNWHSSFREEDFNIEVYRWRPLGQLS